MAGYHFARRLPLLVLVALAHLAALLLLLILTRTQLVRRVEEAPLIVMLLPSVGSTPGGRAKPRRHITAPAVSAGATPPVAIPPAASAAAAPVTLPAETDWAAEARAAAGREIEEEERARRQAAAFGPRHSNVFAPPKHRLEFHWDHARTHRIEPLKGGLGVAVNINDHCALILFGLIPMAGCTVGKIPVRGDLFEHMRDPPEPEKSREP